MTTLRIGGEASFTCNHGYSLVGSDQVCTSLTSSFAYREYFFYNHDYSLVWFGKVQGSKGIGQSSINR